MKDTMRPGPHDPTRSGLADHQTSGQGACRNSSWLVSDRSRLLGAVHTRRTCGVHYKGV